MTDSTELTTGADEPIKTQTPTRAGARANTGGPNYLVLTRDSSLALAIGRLAELQHLSIMLFWSVEALGSTPLLHADAIMIDHDLWRDLQGGVNRRAKATFGLSPTVLMTGLEQPAIIPLGDASQISAVLPRSSGAAAILHAAVKAARGDGD